MATIYQSTPTPTEYEVEYNFIVASGKLETLMNSHTSSPAIHDLLSLYWELNVKIER